MKKYLNVSSFFVLSLIASLLNYLMYPILARILGRTDFTNTNVALALATQITSLMSAVVALAISETKFNPKKSGEVVTGLQSQVTKLYGIVVLVFIIISPILFSQLNLPIKFIIPLSGVLIFTVPIAIISGYFNGKSSLSKLGAVGMIVALFQFLVAIAFGYVSKSGALALLGMAIGQAFSIIVCYAVFSEDNLPKLSQSLYAAKDDHSSAQGPRHSVIVTASLCILALNILQIADLLIIKARSIDVQLYSDLSIVSRVVFFGASMFIWIFLSKLKIGDSRTNVKAFMNLVAICMGILLTSSFVFYIAGDVALRIITGSDYNLSDIRVIGIASMCYRIIYVLNISAVLYLIVTRNRNVIRLPLCLSILTVLVLLCTSLYGASNLLTVSLLNAVGLSGLAYITFLFRKSLSKIDIGHQSDIMQ